METSDNRIEGGCGIVSTGSTVAVSSHKFKRRSVSSVRDFSPGCRRVTASNYGLTVSIVRDFSQGCGRVTASNYGDGVQDYLVLYVIRYVAVYTALTVSRLKAEGWADGHMGVQTLM
ncbi:hypothetical protein J1N35_036691 [Gossypium stocksii]|uniref:Uncharacterized protein n=1 Tax=Gossypium stocksii TaxID=47602 RepID=A0A9D3UIQ3_9ROSI|nr:hypothetical protein J1N35_036691 [Gossypium stocksii]